MKTIKSVIRVVRTAFSRPDLILVTASVIAIQAVIEFSFSPEPEFRVSMWVPWIYVVAGILVGALMVYVCVMPNPWRDKDEDRLLLWPLKAIALTAMVVLLQLCVGIFITVPAFVLHALTFLWWDGFGTVGVYGIMYLGIQLGFLYWGMIVVLVGCTILGIGLDVLAYLYKRVHSQTCPA